MGVDKVDGIRDGLKVDVPKTSGQTRIRDD